MPEGLDVKSISEMYKEVHTVSHTRTRLKGDHIVNSAINATIQRESEYTHKKSTCIEAETVYESIATVGEIRVWWRADFQSGSRVLKKVF